MMELPSESGVEPEVIAAPEPSEAAPPEPAPVAAEAAPAPTGQTEPQHPFWYRKEIEKERKEKAALARRLEQMEAQGPRPQPQAAPDPLEDPNAFYGHIQQTLERQRIVDRLERSEDRFVDKHGDTALEEVRDWLTTRPDIEQWAMGQRDPWGSAHQQYAREKIASEIGDDPKGYEQRLREKILAELNAGGEPAPAGAPQMRPQLPTSAATVRSATPRDPGTGKYTGFKNSF